MLQQEQQQYIFWIFNCDQLWIVHVSPQWMAAGVIPGGAENPPSKHHYQKPFSLSILYQLIRTHPVPVTRIPSPALRRLKNWCFRRLFTRDTTHPPETARSLMSTPTLSRATWRKWVCMSTPSKQQFLVSMYRMVSSELMIGVHIHACFVESLSDLYVCT